MNKYVVLSFVVAVLAGCNSPPPAPSISSVVVTPTTASCSVGGTQPFVAVARDANGLSLNPQPSFSWASSLPSVAGVDAGSGLASCQGAGVTNVTASAGGVTSSPASLTVAAGGARFDSAKFDQAVFNP